MRMITPRMTASRITPRMTACLKQLHLPAFVQHHAPEAALAANEGWPYDRYLLGLCELELAEREQQRNERLLAESRLPREKTIETFNRARLKKNVDRQLAVLREGTSWTAGRMCSFSGSRRRKNASALRAGT